MAGEGQLARQIRTGLEGAGAQMEQPPRMYQPTKVESVLDERLFRKSKRQHVQDFAALFGVIFLLVGTYLEYRIANPALTLSFWLSGIAFAGLGYKAPLLLLPLWSGWMKLGHALGFIVNFLIMGISWWLLAVPIGLLLKLIGKKVMDLSYGAPVETYWEDRPEKQHNFQLLERQF